MLRLLQIQTKVKGERNRRGLAYNSQADITSLKKENKVMFKSLIYNNETFNK